MAFSRSLTDTGISIVRYPKGAEAKYPESVKFEYSPSGLLKTAKIGSGKEQFVIVTYSKVTEECIKAALSLSKEYPDRTFTVISLLQINPLPDDPVLYDAVCSADRLLFVEEHIRSGGIGEKLAASEKVHRTLPIHAIENTKIPCGDLDSIRKFTKMDAESISSRMREEMKKAMKYRVLVD